MLLGLWGLDCSLGAIYGEGPAHHAQSLGSHPEPWADGTVKDTESIPLTDMELLGCSQFCFQGLLTRLGPGPMVLPEERPHPPLCRSPGYLKMQSTVGEPWGSAPA